MMMMMMMMMMIQEARWGDIKINEFSKLRNLSRLNSDYFLSQLGLVG